jgi:outer membrane biosynthesis protein TonB
MSALTILFIFIFLVVLLIFLEYRNEKKYQKQRRRKRQERTSNKRTTPTQNQKKTTPKSTRAPKPEPEVKPEPTVEVKQEPEEKEEVKPEPKKEVPTATKKLPEANYPRFTHVRLVEMGLSDEEAKEFVAELIPQIETEIPFIEAAIQEGDFHRTEKLTHGIKGSATNLGTGGVSDLLVDYNTYLKTGTDVDIAKAYLKHLVDYTNELKDQYT